MTIFHVPWQETDEKVSFALRLIDEDGRAVMQPGATDGLPVQVNGHFEARRQPGMTPGTEINVPMSFNIVLHLTPGRRFSWVLDVDGQADESWQLAFESQAGELAGSPERSTSNSTHDLVLELERAEEAGVRLDPERGLGERGAAPVAAGPGRGHLQPDRLGLAVEGGRALDGAAAGAGRG